MLKKNINIIIIIILYFFTSVVYNNAKEKQNRFNGKVIYLSDNLVELKKGNAEVVFYFSDITMFLDKDGSKGGKDIIEICQFVNANYLVKNRKNVLKRIKIVKDSCCIK